MVKAKLLSILGALALVSPAYAQSSPGFSDGTRASAGAVNDAFVTKLDVARLGAASGVAPLNSGGLVPDANLPLATTSSVGVVKVGAGLAIAGDGTLSTSGSGAVSSVVGQTGDVTAAQIIAATVGATFGTLAAGNDSRITGALQASSAGPLATQAGATSALAIAAGLGFTPIAASGAPVQSVAGRTGTVTLGVADVTGAATTTSVTTETTRATTAEALLAPKASPTFTGTVTTPLTSTHLLGTGSGGALQSATISSSDVTTGLGYTPVNPTAIGSTIAPLSGGVVPVANLPTATASLLGAVKVGTGLAISGGVLSTSGSTTSNGYTTILPALTPQQSANWNGFLTRKTATVTTTAGNTTVTCTCFFVSGNAGMLIDIDQAGTPLTTGEITAVPVTSGGTFLTIPTPITASGGSGVNFIGQPVMGLNGGTVGTAGAGCTNGTTTFTLGGGTNTSTATFTASVSGGVLTPGAAITVLTAGSYTALPFGNGVSGGGCSTEPTFLSPNLTYTINSVTVQGSGYNYPLTGDTFAATGGGVTVAPVFGTPTVVASTPAFASTIVSVTDSSHVVLAAAPGNSLAAKTVWVSYGNDNAQAINDELTALAAGNGGTLKLCGYYGVGSAISVPVTDSIKIEGCGVENTTVYAMAAMEAPMERIGGFSWSSLGYEVKDISFDANGVANYALEDGVNNAIFDSINLYNGVLGLFKGNSGGGNYYMHNIYMDNRDANHAAETFLPPDGLVMAGTDSMFSDIVPRNAGWKYSVRDASAGLNMWSEIHPYGHPPTYWIDTGSWGIWHNMKIDGWCANAAILVSGEHVAIDGGFTENNCRSGIEVGTGGVVGTNLTIRGFDASSAAAALKIVFDGTPDTNSNVIGNAGALTYIGVGGNALQIAGSGAYASNGAVATTMTSVGPTGSHTTVQEWMKVTDTSGNVRYIPEY